MGGEFVAGPWACRAVDLVSAPGPFRTPAPTKSRRIVPMAIYIIRRIPRAPSSPAPPARTPSTSRAKIIISIHYKINLFRLFLLRVEFSPRVR